MHIAFKTSLKAVLNFAHIIHKLSDQRKVFVVNILLLHPSHELFAKLAAIERLVYESRRLLFFEVEKALSSLGGITSRVEGVRIDDLASLKKFNHNIEKITEIGTEVFFLQVVLHYPLPPDFPSFEILRRSEAPAR